MARRAAFRPLTMSKSRARESLPYYKSSESGLLRAWEQGRRAPDRPSRVLLTVIARDPDAVERALAG